MEEGKSRKQVKREQADKRNASYQALPLDEKMARHREGGKVWKKLQKGIVDGSAT